MESQIEALYLAYENDLNIQSLLTENGLNMKEIHLSEKIEITEQKTQFLGQNSAGNRICFEITKDKENEVELSITRGPQNIKNSKVKKLCIE
jgi:hypothetical protein